jgi:uncharacterized protein
LRPPFLALLAIGLAGCSAAAPAAADPHCAGLPALSGRVVDKADMLSPAAEAKLTASLSALEGRTRDQLVVVTLPGLGGRPIEDFGLDLGRCWGVGQKGLDNGVLLIVARADRKVRIEVGYGLENLLRDEVAGEIIRDPILPAFRKGEFQRGIEAGVQRIEAVLLSDRHRPQGIPRSGRT